MVWNYTNVASRTLNESVQIPEFTSSWLPCILEGCLSPVNPYCQTLANFQKSLRALPYFCSYKDLPGKGKNTMSHCGCPPWASSPQPSRSHSSQSLCSPYQPRSQFTMDPLGNRVNSLGCTSWCTCVLEDAKPCDDQRVKTDKYSWIRSLLSPLISTDIKIWKDY